jgi:hypothetical protein
MNRPDEHLEHPMTAPTDSTDSTNDSNADGSHLVGSGTTPMDEPTSDADTTDAAEDTAAGPLAAARKEAAGTRVKLRAAEAQAEHLAGVVEGYQRRDAEQLAAQARPQRLALGSDLWAGGVQLQDLLSEDGAVDPTKISEAVAKLLAARPHWRATTSGIGSGPRQSVAGGPTFSDVLRQR